jgi:hypothetical protein
MTDGPIPLQMPSTPPGWGQDGLSSFWEAGRNNQFGTFVKKRPIFDKLVGIDNAFIAVSKKWVNPKDKIAACCSSDATRRSRRQVVSRRRDRRLRPT